MQFSALTLDIYESPDWVIRVIVALLALGFPFVLFFTWAFEVTPEGIKRESEVDRSRSITHQTARRLDLLTIAMVVVAIGLFSIDRFLLGAKHAAPDSAMGVADAGRGTARVTKQLLEISRLRDLGQFTEPTGHIAPRDVVIRETLDWFDRYLGGQHN